MSWKQPLVAGKRNIKKEHCRSKLCQVFQNGHSLHNKCRASASTAGREEGHRHHHQHYHVPGHQGPLQGPLPHEDRRPGVQ